MTLMVEATIVIWRKCSWACVIEMAFVWSRIAGLFRLAAENGDGYGRVLLGLCCRHGEGIEQNSREALEHFRIASHDTWHI